MNDNIVLDLLENPPFADKFTPCKKAYCTTALGLPYYPRRHVCLRDGFVIFIRTAVFSFKSQG